MNEEYDVNVLNHLSKGCTMAISAIKEIIDKSSGKEFSKVLEKHERNYEEMLDKVNILYNEYKNEFPETVSNVVKTMAWYDIQIKTIKDNSNSKLSEILIKGNVMGLIEGNKLLNRSTIDNDVSSLLKSFIKIQKKSIDELKKFL